ELHGFAQILDGQNRVKLKATNLGRCLVIHSRASSHSPARVPIPSVRCMYDRDTLDASDRSIALRSGRSACQGAEGWRFDDAEAQRRVFTNRWERSGSAKCHFSIRRKSSCPTSLISSLETNACRCPEVVRERERFPVMKA